MLVKEITSGKLRIKQYSTRDAMGKGAANDAEAVICDMIEEKGEVNVIFAAAPSQNETLCHLLQSKKIDWTCVNAFHMDEYIGLESSDPRTFGAYLREHIFMHKPFKSINYVRGYAEDIDAECQRYAELLLEMPPDVVLLGIGENGHIAFNDPWVAEFDDTAVIKAVELDLVCRKQQVNDGCFSSLNEVPTHALTLTVPTLMSAAHLFCTVPAPTKAEALKNTVYGKISEDCPASIMRTHRSAVLYCDLDSGKYLK